MRKESTTIQKCNSRLTALGLNSDAAFHRSRLILKLSLIHIYAKPDINTQPLFYSLRDNEIYLDIGNEEKIDNTFEIVCQWMDKLLIPKMNKLCASE